MEKRTSGHPLSALVAAAAWSLVGPPVLWAQAGDGDVPKRITAPRVLVADHRDPERSCAVTRGRTRPRAAARSRPERSRRAPSTVFCRRRVMRLARARRAVPALESRVLAGAGSAAFGWSACADRPAAPEGASDPHGGALLRTLQTVAPSRQDRLLLRGLLRRSAAVPVAAVRGAGARGVAAGAPLGPELHLIHGDDEVVRSVGGTLRRDRPHHDLERLAQHLAGNLQRESERSLERARLEVQLHRINTSHVLPLQPGARFDSQQFLDSYLWRRGPRSVFAASLSTARQAAVVESVHRQVLAFRDRFLNFTFAYGGYAPASIRRESEEAVAELADRQEKRLVLPGETIDEELDRRRLGLVDRLFSPFQRGRVSLRASAGGFGDAVELVWITPNLEVKVAPQKTRVRLGGAVAGFNVASYSSARFGSWRGRSGLEVGRRLDRDTRLRLAAGVNYGRGREPRRDQLVDVVSVTNDARYVYLAWERSF